MKPRAKKCRVCKKEFIPKRSTLQKVCSLDCAKIEGARQAEKKQKAETRKMKEELMTHSAWLKKLQVTFNAYIRERDKDKPCISCGRPLKGKFDAGHFYSVGAHPELRFYPDNVNGQCVHCNRDKHGNLLEYAERLPQRIGESAFNALKSLRGMSNKLTVWQIKDLIEVYKLKKKELILNNQKDKDNE